MTATLDEDLDLIRALRLCVDPPRDSIDAAAVIPLRLGEIKRLLGHIEAPEFALAFRLDPVAALTAAELPSSAPVIAAVRAHLDENA